MALTFQEPRCSRRSRWKGHREALSFTVYGYSVAQTLVQVLKQCGDDLTRDNVMKEAANIHDLHLDMLLPGISINTGPGDYAPIKQLQMMRFTGERWQLLGPVLTGRAAAS